MLGVLRIQCKARARVQGVRVVRVPAVRMARVPAADAASGSGSVGHERQGARYGVDISGLLGGGRARFQVWLFAYFHGSAAHLRAAPLAEHL